MRLPILFGSAFVCAVAGAPGCSSGLPGGAGGTSGAGGSAGTSATGGTAGSATGGTSGTTGSGGTTGNRGVMPGDSGVTIDEKNFYGVPYPTDNIGTATRKGSIAGNQIQNFGFLGYVNAAQGSPTVDTGAPVSISLSSFFDPENRKYKLLHISVAAEWCTPCNEETDEVTGEAKSLAGQGVVIMQALTEGYTQGTGAVTADLHTWIAYKKIDYDMVLDPEATNLGEFFNESAIPWNADIDVRTMEILEDGVGYSGNEKADIEQWLSWVENNPPGYACPSGEKLSGKKCVPE